eukprot:CAMPEP_0196658978 /NCGR_PEP_ID=MMETSP1086-20130531/32570_1 /TAXON_ID=77921 /ORGANISM="Cyanoptyche  gloeocystis , Strain SAG4.97" /LENGTH=41 /DNA_ID= /DNA_START= /DNA_END= /DNA_ORIENTATION=
MKATWCTFYNATGRDIMLQEEAETIFVGISNPFVFFKLRAD